MALRTAGASGFWDAGGTWVGGIVPSGADTFATSTFTVTVRTSGGAAGCAGGTITAGGKLSVQSTAGFTLTGAVTWNGTWEVLGSGNGATPTLQTNNGIWQRGVSSVANIIGTTGVTTPDIKIITASGSYYGFNARAYATDIIRQVEFNGGGSASIGVFTGTLDYPGTGSVYEDILFKACTKPYGAFTGVMSINFTGTIVFDGTIGTYVMGPNAVVQAMGTAVLKSINNAANLGQLAGPKFFGSITYWKNDSIVETALGIAASFCENTRLVHDNVSIAGGVSGVQVSMLDNSSCNLSTTVANQIMFSGVTSVNTTGLIEIATAPNGIILCRSILSFTLNNLSINVTTGTVVLNMYHLQQIHWQASRSKRFDIVGATTVTLNGTGSLPQYEPVAYRYVIATNMYALQYDMTVGCPNYTELFGTSTGWTAATKTLAAGGVLRILTTGNTATGMDLAIKSFAAAAIAHPVTDTAVVVWTFKISFDGGVLWSAELTLAQLQTDVYIINGNSYSTNGAYDIQLEIIGTSAGGGTLTQVRLTGIEIDPYITSSWSVYQNFKDIEGAGFATGTDDLNTIKDTAKAIKNLAGALQ